MEDRKSRDRRRAAAEMSEIQGADGIGNCWRMITDDRGVRWEFDIAVSILQ